MDLLQIGIGLIVGLIAGAASIFLMNKQKKRNAQKEATSIIKRAEISAEKMERDAYLKAKEKYQQERQQMQRQFKNRESETSKREDRLRVREKQLRRTENDLKEEERSLKKEQQRLRDRETHLAKKAERADAIVDEQLAKLEAISGINREEAKKNLVESLKDRANSEIAQHVLDIKNEAVEKARFEAKEILAFAIERMATDYTMEATLVTVSLPSESMKGLIIGREGRNIKSFENITGVKVIVDDTPETVVMSSFDPVKREVARRAMEALIKKKTINPKAIQRESDRAQRAVDESVRQAAEETLKELGLKNVHPEMRNYLGRLKYRSSYGQNILHHSKEVAWLAGNMANELGLDVALAKRAGLFHDIGKAVSNDAEGSHVTIGVDITTKYNEHPVVINSVLAHHEEADPISPVSVLVTAADRISGARPGARRESVEAYAQRISKLEELANSFDGVSKTYAISAGREIRVLIQPDKIDDAKANMLASDIARKIKESLEYPGQIKVTVVRHLIATSSTDEYLGKNSNGKGKIAV
ncbi:MAG: ribonuclease Y [Calditrichia bacterium]